MEGQHFIITSLQIWEIEIGTTIRNIALEISKQNKVLYINTPLDHFTWLRSRNRPKSDHRIDVIRKKMPPVKQINENLWVLNFPFMIYSVNRLPTSFLFDFFNKINNRKMARYIQKQAKTLNFDNNILFIDNDIYRSQYMKEFLSPRLSIYYRRDYVIGRSYWKKNGTRLEPKLILKSDLVMANSEYFRKELSQNNPNSFLFETGVNMEIYTPTKTYPTPEEIRGIPRPIVGYVGSVNIWRLDEEVMCLMAEERPEYSFVYTGPEDDHFKKSRLHQFKNVYFTGSKEVCNLPSYIFAFDICINPQIINDITLGNYPLKIDEYLALGKPVVATETPGMIESFYDQVHLAKNAEDYLRLIDLALEESKDENLQIQRIKFAHTHSWECRVNMMYKTLESFMEQKNESYN
ncbi:MAG: glycosyltransferase [Bacteroidales bacterium]|nr:glycosyltransferase [Bacteroidales bacterium]